MSTAFVQDLVERSVRTFVQTVLGVAAAGVAGVVDIDGAKALLISSVAAGLSAVMSLLSRSVGDPQSGSVLPPH